MTVSNRPTNAALRRTSGAPAVRLWLAMALSIAVHAVVIFALRPHVAGDPDVPAVPPPSRLTAAIGVGHASRLASPASLAPPAVRNQSATVKPVPVPVLTAPQPAVDAAPTVLNPPPMQSPVTPRAESLPEEMLRPDAVREVLPMAAGDRTGGRAAQASVVTTGEAGPARGGTAAGPVGEDPPPLAGYRQALIQAALGYKRYPPLARERGWEGTVELSVVVLPRHPTPVLKVSRSSGFALLDDQALEMMSRAVRRLPVPEALQSVRGSFVVPIRFQLGD